MADWERRVAEERARRDASIAKLEPKLDGLPTELPLSSQKLPSQFLTDREIEITERYTVPELLAALKARNVSVEEVTRAFLRRATNCLTSLLWDEAIARAKHLDSLPEPKGLLFGLPISTKEHHGTVNNLGQTTSTNASNCSWIGKPHSAPLLYQSFWDEGCVFYCRTTQPQTIMHLETDSNVYGLTVNPYNRNLTPGGSSGGEGALIGMRGSLVGIGGDIGGSVRCPAAHCGIYAFKPTNKRLTSLGIRGHMSGKEAMMSTPGPMTTDRETLEIIMRAALASEPWRLDPAVTFKPWTPVTFTKPLKIAVQWWDGVVTPHPPMRRALREVSEACRKAGIKVVHWDCEKLDHRKGWEIISSLYWPDGGEQVLNSLKETGEPVLPLSKWIIEEQPSVKNLTQQELWDRTAEREAYRTAYAQAWTATADADGDGQEVDVILCPPSFGAAPPFGQSKYWGYTANWNLLDYPGVVFPVTTVDPQKDPKDVDYEPKNAEDKFCHELYDPEVYANAPVGLQIVGRRQYDEKVLAALVEIERAMGRK
ncbi:hypothetical protein Q7P36_010665 [Cladosporium allicinum]